VFALNDRLSVVIKCDELTVILPVPRQQSAQLLIVFPQYTKLQHIVFILQQNTFVNTRGTGVTHYKMYLEHNSIRIVFVQYTRIYFAKQRTISMFSALLIIKVKTILFVLFSLPVYQASFQ
jgi:hypothetical protein